MQAETILTVTTPATSYDLTTLAVVKDELGITTNASDATLGRYLSWASAAIAQECNRVFPLETLTQEFWWTHDRVVSSRRDLVQLCRWPLGTVTSVTEDGTPLAATTDYRANATNGQLLRLDSSSGHLRSWWARTLVVVYAAGFAPIPGDLADAVTRMVRNRFRAKGRDSYLMQESIPGIREARWWIATGNEAGNVPPDIADLIDGYRVPVIA